MNSKLIYLKDVVTLELNPDKCTGCAKCTAVCPRGVLEMTNGKAHIVDRDACIECGACALNCKDSALSVDSGVGCASAFINGALGRNKACC